MGKLCKRTRAPSMSVGPLLGLAGGRGDVPNLTHRKLCRPIRREENTKLGLPAAEERLEGLRRQAFGWP